MATSPAQSPPDGASSAPRCTTPHAPDGERSLLIPPLRAVPPGTGVAVLLAPTLTDALVGFGPGAAWLATRGVRVVVVDLFGGPTVPDGAALALAERCGIDLGDLCRIGLPEGIAPVDLDASVTSLCRGVDLVVGPAHTSAAGCGPLGHPLLQRGLDWRHSVRGRAGTEVDGVRGHVARQLTVPDPDGRLRTLRPDALRGADGRGPALATASSTVSVPRAHAS